MPVLVFNSVIQKGTEEKCYCGKISRSKDPTNLVAAHICRAKGFSEIRGETVFCLLDLADSADLQRSHGFVLFCISLLSLQLENKVDTTIAV